MALVCTGRLVHRVRRRPGGKFHRARSIGRGRGGLSPIKAITMTLEDHLLTESRNPRSESIDTLSPLELVELINSEDAKVVEAVGAEAQSIARAVEWAADRLRRGGRLVYVGAGTSGRLGVLDASECPPTFSTPPGMVVGLIAGGPTALTRAVEGAEDDPKHGASDIAALEVGKKTWSSALRHRGGPLMSSEPCARRNGEARAQSGSRATVPVCWVRRSTSISCRSSVLRSSLDPRA